MQQPATETQGLRSLTFDAATYDLSLARPSVLPPISSPRLSVHMRQNPYMGQCGKVVGGRRGIIPCRLFTRLIVFKASP